MKTATEKSKEGLARLSKQIERDFDVARRQTALPPKLMFAILYAITVATFTSSIYVLEGHRDEAAKELLDNADDIYEALKDGAT